MDDQYIKSLFKGVGPIFGISPNAFSRVVPGDFVENYFIICYKNRKETEVISKDKNVFCIEKLYPNVKPLKVNAKEILSLNEVKEFIKSKGGDAKILLYKPTPSTEKIAKEMGWKVIANTYELANYLENKKTFREALENSGATPVVGETFLFDDLNLDLFHSFQEKYGKKLVFQVAEMTAGGGTGTAFLEADSDLEAFINKIKPKKETFNKIKNVNVTKFITGDPASIVACVTRQGILTGVIQNQIQDIGDVRTITDGNGLFCGHDWGFGQYSDNMQKQAKDIAKKFGEHIKALGYKGIFGMDLIANKDEDSVYPIECNPRYTDAFPVFSEMAISKGLVPMDVFHILEFLDVDYEYDIEELSKKYDQEFLGAQIILETKTDKFTKVNGVINPGIYSFDHNGEIKYLKEGYRFEQLENDNEVLVTEGVPTTGTIFKPGARIVRLVFKKSILEKIKELTLEIKSVITYFYKVVNLEEIETPKEYIANEDN